MTAAMHIAVRGSAVALALFALGARFMEPRLAASAHAANHLTLTRPARDVQMASLPPLFGGMSAAAAAADLPRLVGIAGRVPDDGQALVELATGKAQTVREGDLVSGWKVTSIEPDRVVLERDGVRQAVKLKPQ